MYCIVSRSIVAGVLRPRERAPLSEAETGTRAAAAGAHRSRSTHHLAACASPDLLSVACARARRIAVCRCAYVKPAGTRVYVCCVRTCTCARALSEGARQPEERNSLVNCWLYPFYLYFPHSKRDEYIRAPPLPPRKKERKGERKYRKRR